MLRTHLAVFALIAGTFALAGCQATSTAGPYHPANCAMVGSRCASGR